jgi:hypothetical protein
MRLALSTVGPGITRADSGASCAGPELVELVRFPGLPDALPVGGRYRQVRIDAANCDR